MQISRDGFTKFFPDSNFKVLSPLDIVSFSKNLVMIMSSGIDIAWIFLKGLFLENNMQTPTLPRWTPLKSGQI